MRTPEPYWTLKGPPIPDLADVRGGFAGSTSEWESLSPGLRRAIYRETILSDARRRELSCDIIDRLRVALIAGALPHLDAYLMAFESEDARRAPIAEDAQRMHRADLNHAQAQTQIAAREADFLTQPDAKDGEAGK